MKTPRQKTTTRTIRLPSNIDDILQKDAKEKRTTVNSLISSALTKYAEWDRYAESEEIGSRQPKELMMFIFKKLSLDNFVSQTSLFSRYAGFGTYEIETDERNYTFVIHHELGRKWSTFLAYLGAQGLKSTLGVVPKFNVTEYSVVFEFFVP
jgi:hypothetical protein